MSINKLVHIFTDDEDQFVKRLTDEAGRRRQNVHLHPCSSAASFSVAQATNPWTASFDNQEVLTQYEVQ